MSKRYAHVLAFDMVSHAQMSPATVGLGVFGGKVGDCVGSRVGNGVGAGVLTSAASLVDAVHTSRSQTRCTPPLVAFVSSSPSPPHKTSRGVTGS